MNFWRTLADLLLPRHCVVCDAELACSEEYVCNVCLMKHHMIHWSSAEDNPLLRVLWNSHDVERAGSSFFYNTSQEFHNLFLEIKYHGCPHLGKIMASEAFPYWQTLGLGVGADCIIPVPLSRRRRLQRGYNQSEWIARGVSEVSGIPVRTDILRRVKDNESQTHKNAWQRKENTRGIFAVREDCESLDGKTILLVDDIFTTGATIAACIHALKESFPLVSIHVYTLGRAGG